MDNGQVVSVDGEASNKRSSLKDVKFTYELKIVPGAGSDFSAPIEVSFGDADREVAFSAGVGVNVVPYKHSSLRGPNSIRILTLLPSAEFDSPIDVQLAEVDLPSKPDYEALSYAWGDTKNKVGISCHGRRLDVTVNCALALQNLRHEYQARTLWVDAICIDQTLANEAERNQQVRIMGNVYETAQRVLVWLGPRGAKSDLEIAMLKSFEKVVGEDNATQDAFAERVYDQLKENTSGQKIFNDLSKRPWFQRLWTIQEVALAREALVICGKWSISWSLLLLAMSRLSRLERASGRFDAFSVFEYTLGGRQRITNALSSDKDLPVSTVFTRGLFYQAQVRKDHIFGIYTILQKLGANLPQPDYGRPVDQIFAEAARLAVENDNRLYILSFVNRLEERENWPSWVPTWNEQLNSVALDERWFKAALGSPPLFTFSGDSRCLTVKAKKIDVVALKADRSPLLGDPYTMADDIGQAAASIESTINAVKAFQEWMIVMHTWRLFGRMVSSPYGDGEEQTLAFLQVLMQDCTAVPESLGKFGEILRGFQPWQQLLSAMNPGSSTPMTVIEAMLEPEDVVSGGLPENKRHLVQTPEWKIHSVISKNPGASLFDHHATLGCKGKVFFITARGYFGVAPASIRQGDAVVLVSGFQTPLLVRPVEDGGIACRLLGPAYVMGMMKGELWPQAERDLSDLTFV